MSLQAITLRVPIGDDWDGGHRVQVYTDRGSGTVDTSRPLLARPAEIFPGQLASKGYGMHPWGRGRFGDNKPSRPRTGVYGRQIYGVSPYGNPEPFMEVTVEVPAAFGAWKFGVEVVDRFGTVQSGGLQEIVAVVSGTDPAPVSAFAVAGYDSQTDQVTFGFEKNTE